MSAFNTADFINAQFNEANDTRFPQVPNGEYTATIRGPYGDEKATHIKTTDKGHVILQVVWDIDDETLKASLGLKTLSARQSIFLDMTPQGGLDFGEYKNSRLGLLRTAIGLNEKGKAWSFNDFIGRPAKVMVRKDGEYTNVVSVAKL